MPASVPAGLMLEAGSGCVNSRRQIYSSSANVADTSRADEEALHSSPYNKKAPRASWLDRKALRIILCAFFPRIFNRSIPAMHCEEPDRVVRAKPPAHPLFFHRLERLLHPRTSEQGSAHKVRYEHAAGRGKMRNIHQYAVHRRLIEIVEESFDKPRRPLGGLESRIEKPVNPVLC